MIHKFLLLLVIFGLLFTGCGNLPRDPKETLQHAQQNHRLRVGLVEHPPWVVRTGGEPAGAEVELVRRFAKELGVTPEWLWGGEQEHLEALEHYQLDLVIGGLTDATPWSKYVGLTAPYFVEHISVGVPPTMQSPETLKRAQVAVTRGDPIGGYLERKGAQVVNVDNLKQAEGAVAAPDWQLEQMGLNKTGFELRTENHVMATPPGENALIKRLDDFLYAQSAEIKGLLQQEVARQ